MTDLALAIVHHLLVFGIAAELALPIFAAAMARGIGYS